MLHRVSPDVLQPQPLWRCVRVGDCESLCPLGKAVSQSCLEVLESIMTGKEWLCVPWLQPWTRVGLSIFSVCPGREAGPAHLARSILELRNSSEQLFSPQSS